MQYATHYEEGKKVSFKKFDLHLAGLLFLPDGKYPAVVVTHPGGGVKEQCSSLYAWHLARAGYVALAFDASHQGESEGLPRCLEDPTSRVEDIRSAVDLLVTLPYVDEERIGAMGICAGGGYTMSAIQTDVRIKAAAGISTWDVFPVSRSKTSCRNCCRKWPAPGRRLPGEKKLPAGSMSRTARTRSTSIRP